MKIDLYSNNTRHILENSKIDYDCVSIGNEFCFYKMKKNIDYNIEYFDDFVKRGKEIRILTPFVSNEHFDSLVKMIDEIYLKYHDNISFIINDFGVLGYINKNFCEIKKLYIGQMLNYSLEEYLWNDVMLQGENSEVKKIWKMDVFANEELLQYFKSNFKIKGIVLNNFSNREQEVSLLNTLDMEPIVVLNYHVMAVSRVCNTVKFFDIKAGENCENLCDNDLNIDLDRIYDIENISIRYRDASVEIKERAKNWIVRGNILVNKYNYDNYEGLSNATVRIDFKDFFRTDVGNFIERR